MTIDMVLEDVTELYVSLYFHIVRLFTYLQRLLGKPYETVQDSIKRKQHMHGKMVSPAICVCMLSLGS